jgi:diguanylate cyclase (GGDEF)-like protein/PAS domain S-box-containing protein
MTAKHEIALGKNEELLDRTLATLKGCPYFRTMKEAVLRHVLAAGVYLEVPAETALIRDGELDDDIYFLLEGAVGVFSDGKRVLTLGHAGDVIGEFAVVSTQPRSADVRTDSAARLVRVSSAVVKQPETDPAAALEFLNAFGHIMAAKLRETTQRAKLYEEAVVQAQDLASSKMQLEGEVQDRLQEVLLYSKVVELSNDPILIADTEGVVQRVNPQAAKLFGRGAGSFAGKPVLELAKDFDLGGFKLGKTQLPWQGEWRHGVDQKQRVFQTTISPIIGNSGATISISYQLRDISRERAQEHAIALKNEEIRKALTDLEETYGELQRSDRLKMESLTVISNELASPIRKILNHSTKLIEQFSKPLRPDVINHLNSIQDQAVFLKAVGENINHLIDLQQDLSATVEEELDLNLLVKSTCDDLEPKARRKQIALDLHLPEHPLTLHGHAERFKVMLNLLLEQAIMVAQNRTKITVDGYLMDLTGQVHLEIRYTGPSLGAVPMNVKDQNRMSLLIGLPLARKVISQYQGSLQFLKDGEITRIWILLPRKQQEGEERPNRIMIADEREIDRLIIRGVIEHQWPGSVVLETEDPFEFLENYEDFRPDLVIADPDITEPGWANHRIIASLVQDRRHICPVLSVSTLYQDFAERTIAIERGVTDFLAKPYSIFDLQFKVNSLISSHRKEESLHANMDQAQRQAYTDGLTKLANRKHFDGFLATQINYSRQTKKPCSLIMIDVDNFKHYNDTNGHQLGDEVLKGVARILQSSVRSSDLAARYGGEEFVIVLPETKKEMAVVIAEKMRRAVTEHDFPNGNKQPLGFVSASFGVSTFSEDADDGEGLLKAADECLYVAKEQGRNMVVKAGAETAAAAAAPKAGKAH